ncbi:MAG: NADH-quinone oxidoreductase subunit J [Candidatus Heimdallarchaeaceae archaeon]
MVSTEFIEIVVIMSLALLSALLALELKNLFLSVLNLILMNLFVWGVFLIFKATLVAWLQLIIYGGGLTALFLVVVSLTEKQVDEQLDWKRSIVGASITIPLIGVATWLVSYFDIDTTNFANLNDHFISNYLTTMWSSRLTDVLLQVLVFFATAIAITVLFLEHKKSKKTKEEIES